MDLFSISQLSQFSGVKPHTIRIWEQRYNALSPIRSEGNTRYYNNDQLRRLLNIVSLMGSDYKISELCSMSDDNLYRILEKEHQTVLVETDEYFVLQLIAAGVSYNESQFDKIFSHCLLRYGMKEAYVKVIYPMLIRIGLMWSCNVMPPAPEHFISNLLRQKLLTAIDSLSAAKSARHMWLLFLPENEFHEIGLLFAQYLIRLSGRRVIYLGANVPQQSLIAAIEETKPDKLLLFLVQKDLIENTQEYINKLSNIFIGKEIFISGNQELRNQLRLPKKIKWLQSVDELMQLLTNV